jgi:hypothetical protein
MNQYEEVQIEVLSNDGEEAIYNKIYSTFDEYCEKKWGFVGRTANLYIQASQVAENIEKNGMLTSPKDTIGRVQVGKRLKADENLFQQMKKEALLNRMGL